MQKDSLKDLNEPEAPEVTEIEDFVWLQQIGRYRAYNLHQNLMIVLPGVLGVCIAFLVLTGFRHPRRWLIALALGLILYVVFKVSRWYVHSAFVCPACGYNPTRRKSDSAPRADEAKVHAQLRRYTQCPECGSGAEAEAPSRS